LGGDYVSVEVHEASHAAAAIMLGREVESVWRTEGLAFAGEMIGHCGVPIDRLEASQVVICTIGYMSEDKAGWPPSWPDALEEPLEALGRVLTLLGATKKTYEQLVEIARSMLDDPAFIRLRDAIARALHRCPHLEAEDVQALAAIYQPREEIRATPSSQGRLDYHREGRVHRHSSDLLTRPPERAH
jgi:hypothetical protein